MTIWSFAVQDGNPGISQVVHQREGMHYVHWHTGCISAHPHGKAYTEILPVHSHWLSVPVQLGCLLLGIYQGSKVSPRGQSPCLPGLLAYLRLIPCTGQFGPASVAAPRLGDPFQQVWFATRTAVQFHLYAIQYVHLHRDTPAQNGDQNPEHATSLEIAHPRVTTRDLHRLLGMLTFMVTLVPRGQFCFCPIQWWASEAWCQETGSWSDRISVAPTILPGGWVDLSCSAAWGLTECLTDRDHSLYRCIQAQMEAQLGSHKLQGMWSRQQASQHINMRWRQQCSWV